MHVLLVEDNDGDADLVVEALRGSPNGGVELSRVTRLAGAVEALTAPAGPRFDVALLDLSLPDATGLDALIKLRAVAPALAIVVLTGMQDAAVGTNAIRQGAQDFLEKGLVGSSELLRAIRYARERAQVSDRARILAHASTAIGSSRVPALMMAAVSEAVGKGYSDWCGWAGADLPPAEGERPSRATSRHPAEATPGQLFASFMSAAVGESDRARVDQLATRGMASAIVVPFRAHGWANGEVTFARTARSIPYGMADLVLAEEIARRVASAIDYAALLDIAEHERERAEVASRVRDEFLATLSHELRTPLNAILGWTLLLRAGSVPEEKHGKALETIERNARSQVALIEDVLEVSRIITGKTRLTLGPVDLAAVLASALESIRPATQAKGVHLESVADPSLGTVQGDADRLLQVLWNLLSNAVKFTPRGGHVAVRMERDETWIGISVEDDGQGIAPDLLPHVFERFRQGDSTTTRSHGGLGLGLAIARHLVELQGGTLVADSRGAGTGATFTLRLPVAPVAHDAAADSIRAPAAPPSVAVSNEQILSGLQILVVDDDEDARDLLGELLESVGARVASAPSAKDGLTLLKERRPDVVLSDVGMPGKNGYEFMREVRALPASEGGATPSIALTAYARSDDRERALESGFNQHVSKPLDPGGLVTIILGLCGRTKGTAALES